MKKTVLIMLLYIVTISLYGQQKESNSLWMEYIEELSESEIDENTLENLMNELSYLSEHPFDLYSVTKTDLEKLPFLSQIQIENLLYYVYKNAPLLSIYELRNVEALDMQTIRYLLPFIYLSKEPVRAERYNTESILKYGKSELLVRSDYCFQKKSGYTTPSSEEKDENPNQYYLGEPFYLSVRYDFTYKEKFQFGLAGEKDQGETLWNRKKKGPDYYSFHFTLKNTGMIQALHLGDYRLSFGQGLVINTDFSIGKTSGIMNINKKNGGIKRHFSTNENDFFRGGATTLKLGNTNVSLFLSHRKVDANTDSINILSFKTDGYNRTEKDLEKKNQATINLAGINTQWRNDFLHIGFTGVYYKFGDKTLNPEKHPYNLFYLRGKDNYNLGLNYSIQRKKYFFQGETAISKNGKIATLNTLQINPVSYAGLIFSHRNYAKNYHSLYGRAFSESSSLQSESGFYWGVYLNFLKNWEVRTYFDFFQFPWLKYGVDSPSEGSDILCQLTYKPSSNMEMFIRYKFKEKEKNYTSENSEKNILPYKQHRLKYQLNYQIKKDITIKTQLNHTTFINTQNFPTTGWSISLSGGYNPNDLPVKIDVGFSYFNASDWDSRISLYEKNILYAFSSSSLYGKGARYYAIVKADILNNLSIYTKWANTTYFDRNVISSGLEEIDGNNKTDLYCLIRLKF